MTPVSQTPRAKRPARASIGLDRRALIDRLTQADDELDLMLLKRPEDLTEAEVRRVAERRLALPAGVQKEELDAFERAFYDHAYGSMPAAADDTGRLIAPAVQPGIAGAPIPARSAEGIELSEAVFRLAGRVADIAESHGSRDAVRFLQQGLTIISQALTAANGTGSTPGAYRQRPLFPDLKEDGDPGPVTRSAIRRTMAKLGLAKVEEALALGRFEHLLRGVDKGNVPDPLGRGAAVAFGHLFRDEDYSAGDRPTEEGESLQMAVNDLGSDFLGSRDFATICEDGMIGPKTEAALRRVLKAAGPRRMTEAMGRNLGFFLFDPPWIGGRFLRRTPAYAGPASGEEENFGIK